MQHRGCFVNNVIRLNAESIIDRLHLPDANLEANLRQAHVLQMCLLRSLAIQQVVNALWCFTACH